ncbi:MAG: hypothetical protein IPI66_07650 [Chitinophagaceae bacterium]|nr:hypothetical protein [Chitinophagaceae bacterium]
MKKILIIMACFLSVSSADAQRITWKDFIGTWDLADSSSGKTTYHFTDSIHSEILFNNKPAISGTVTYKTDFVNNISRLWLIMEENGKKTYSYFMLKKVSAECIKMQIDFLTGPPVWLEETAANTGVLFRRH